MNHDHVTCQNFEIPQVKGGKWCSCLHHSFQGLVFMFSFDAAAAAFLFNHGALVQEGFQLKCNKTCQVKSRCLVTGSILGWHVGATCSFPTDMIVEPMCSEGSNVIAWSVQHEYCTFNMITIWKTDKVMETHDNENALNFYVFSLMLLRFSLIMAGHRFRKGSNLQQNVPDEIQMSCNRVYLGLTCRCNLQLSHRHDCRTYVLGEFQLDCKKRTTWVHSTWQQHEKRTKRWKHMTIKTQCIFMFSFWCCCVSL